MGARCKKQDYTDKTSTLSDADQYGLVMRGQQAKLRWEMITVFIWVKKAIFSGFTDKNPDRNTVKNSSQANELGDLD